MKNKLKYFITTPEEIVAIVYEHEKYGRTMVIYEAIQKGRPVEVTEKCENGDHKKVCEKEMYEFLYEMLPVDE